MGVKEIILNNNFLHRTLLSAYAYAGWYGNKLTNYYFERKRFRRHTGYSPNIKKPRSFNEKILHKKIYDRNPILAKTADKYLMREYVKEVLGKKEGEKHLIPLLHVTDKPEKIPFEKLPKDFVVKANHGSGWNIIVRDGKYDKKDIIKKCKTWLNTPYGLEKIEWAYKNIKRKIIIEQLITDENGNLPKDYKFHMIHGKIAFIQVDNDRFKKHTRSLFDKDWNYINASLKFTQGPDLQPPENLKKMKEVVAELSKKFDFVRIDLYSLNEKIYVGEITHYPGSGCEKFTPEQKDFELGKEWKIEKEYWKK